MMYLYQKSARTPCQSGNERLLLDEHIKYWGRLVYRSYEAGELLGDTPFFVIAHEMLRPRLFSEGAYVDLGRPCRRIGADRAFLK